LLVGIVLPGDAPTRESPLAELGRLAGTAGAVVLGTTIQKRSRLNPATCVGAGKAEEIGQMAAALGCDVVIFDRDLSAAQARNLDRIIGRRVVDRSELILDIFAQRARTRQARVQVELAQLEYMRPRLRRMWTHLSRIEGGIGMRGPGEKQIETDRRAIRRRIQTLERELAAIERQHETRSASRREFFKVSIVGYTNAGKSTLLSALTGADTLIEDRLFATLDTTTRAWSLPGGKRVFLSDTVGFIRGLPHHLVASFHATLAEARDADLLLHVVDASNPDAGSQTDTVTEVLETVGAGHVRVLTVLNKVDQVSDRMALAAIRPRMGRSVVVSARTGEGLGELESAVLDHLQGAQVEVEVVEEPGDGRLFALLAEKGHILEQSFPPTGKARIRVLLPRRIVEKLRSEGRCVLDAGSPPAEERTP
jgi:GTP-binding protein HflX